MEKLLARGMVLRHGELLCRVMPISFSASAPRNPARGFWPVCWLTLGALLAGCARHHDVDTTARYQAGRVSEYQQRYHNPLLSPGAQFATLPPAVQRTVRAEAGAANIETIVKDTNGVDVVYRIYFRSQDVEPTLYVARDGTLLNPDLSVAIGAAQDTVGVLTGGPVTGITLSDLPPQVMKKIQERAPNAEVAYINKEKRGDQTTYNVVFKDRMHPPLEIAADGTVLSGSTPGRQ